MLAWKALPCLSSSRIVQFGLLWLFKTNLQVVQYKCVLVKFNTLDIKLLVVCDPDLDKVFALEMGLCNLE